ncbi:peptide MFS transporter [Sphingomonas sp. SRS2]|uniref:peptide MFS transporter n=1 Tax=Sphingomonas sp. SRS2 TaxID=133190 RepID=UPI000696F61C|nr:peptide MFS transporter [Sphingomonas sp. SRS2]
MSSELPPSETVPAGRTAFGHPRGLAYIAFAEAWERFSFYGMQALLMLYMTQHLLKPGVIERVAGADGFRHGVEAVFGTLSDQAFASQVFGLYVGFIYFAPIFGGWLGDRLTGRTVAVLGGAFSMAIGHFLMAFEAAFLPALFALIVGSGLLKGNLAAQVGALYPITDRRRDAGYTIYFTAINIGAFVAPLICGSLGEFVGWHYGFGAAGIGMLLAIAIYVSGLKYMPTDRVSSATRREKLSATDRRAIVMIAALLAITSIFWTIQAQVWNIYPLWVRDVVDRNIGGGIEIPVSWFQSLDALTVLILAPIAVVYWRFQARRQAEPNDIAKLAIGNVIFAAAALSLAIAQMVSGNGGVSFAWPVAFHFLIGAGYVYCAPVALALVSRVAPAAVNAMMVGAFYLGLFAGGIFSGWLARFYEPLGPIGFWAMHAGIGLTGAVAVLLLGYIGRDLLIADRA